MTVFLATDDGIVPSAAVKEYLGRVSNPFIAAPEIFEGAGHGEWQYSKAETGRVVAAALSARDAVAQDTRVYSTMDARGFRLRDAARRWSLAELPILPGSRYGPEGGDSG